MRHLRLALPIALLILTVPAFLPGGRGLGGVALAAKGGGGGAGGSGGCTRYAPGVSVDNNYAWASPGSWGMPGQQLKYAINIRNYDVGCGSSSFLVSMTARSGFTVSIPTSTISINSYTSAYAWAYVTSPASIADGDNPLTVAVQRVGTSTWSAPYTTYYKVYSSDTTAPTLYYATPGDGATVTGRSTQLSVQSNDDHAVKKIELYVGNVLQATTVCDDISYTCQLAVKVSLSAGQHSATFKSHDWMGNVGV